MKFNHKLLVRYSLISSLFLILFASCVPIKRIQYLQQEVAKNDTLRTHFNTDKSLDYKIQAGDNLYIKVNSPLTKTENLFATEDLARTSNYYNDVGIYLNSYQVSDSGYIDFPFVGKVYIKDLTLEQAKDLVQAIVDDYVRGTTVIVRLAIFKITILGEVVRPGEFSIYQNNLNLFDALSYAGDMTPFAKRNNVYLIRETKKGTKVTTLNLNDIGILESEYFTILPNDIIYVPPVKAKNFAFSNFPYSVVFSSISTALLLINFFNN